MRRLLAGAGLMLAAAFLTACGGPPEDASEEDFCDSFKELFAFDEKPSQDDWDEAVEKIKDTGTPEDIPDEAREGYEDIVEAMEDIDVDDEDANKEAQEQFEDSDQAKEFGEYYTETCAGLDEDELPPTS